MSTARVVTLKVGRAIVAIGWNKAWWDYEYRGMEVTHLLSLEWWGAPYMGGLHFFAGPVAIGVVW